MIDRIYGFSAGLLRTSSLLACLIVAISFVLFATDQLGTASSQQAAQIGGPDPALNSATATPAAPETTAATPPQTSGLRHTINQVSQRLTSPFNGFVGSSTSQWLVRSVETGLALLVYGFGMGYLVRVLRIRS